MMATYSNMDTGLAVVYPGFLLSGVPAARGVLVTSEK